MKYVILVFLFLFAGCSIKDYENTETKIITIKSPKIKFSDLGYIRNSDKSIELELFIAGNSVEKISVNHLVCVSDGCMSKSGFNEDYMYKDYPDDILQNILLSKPIYDSKNMKKNSDGFEQHIENENVDISYRVNSHATFFKDRKNRIIFKIKEFK